MSQKGPRLLDEDIKGGIYPVGTDQYVRLVHVPTGIVVGQELNGRSPQRVKSELLRNLHSKVFNFEREKARKLEKLRASS